MENTGYTQTKQFKRTSRHPSDATKQKISAKLKGRSKPDSVKTAISTGMKKYWGNNANFPEDSKRNEGGD